MKNIPLLISLVLVCNAAAQVQPPVAVPLGACPAILNAPARMAIDPAGNLYVSDPQAGRVVVLDSVLRPVASREVVGLPLGIAADQQGRIFLADGQMGSVSVFDAGWKVLYKLGAGDGEFQLPNHIALAPGTPGPTVFVCDSKADEVKAFVGSSVVAKFGTHGSGVGQFDFPAGICVNTKQEVFVVDQNNDRVQVFDSQGTYLRSFTLGGTAGSPSGRAQGAFVDAAGRLYAADSFQGVVKVFDAASGVFLSNIGSFGRAPGQISSPAGMTLDGFNRLFVSSAGSERVEVYGLDSFLHLSSEPAAGLVAAGEALVLRAITGGTGPYTFQWRKNGIELAGATDATFAISQSTSENAGGYLVAVTGPSGTQISGVAQVQVLTPPAIVNAPADLAVLRGSNVLLQVTATGSSLSYQWQLNGRNLEGATNNSLLLAEVQSYQAGAYSVVVSNAVGTAVTPMAQLTVLVPPAVVEIVAASMALDGQFHLTLNADPGFSYALESTEDFLTWGLLTSFYYDAGMQEFVDPGSTNFPNRFYRFRWLP